MAPNPSEEQPGPAIKNQQPLPILVFFPEYLSERGGEKCDIILP